MTNTLSNFKSTLIGGGARPNLFQVDLYTEKTTTTTNSTNDVLKNLPDSFPILCKAAALPASNIGSIDVPFRGRIFKVAGDRTFDTWTVTIINDEDFGIRNAMELWMQKIGQYSDGSGASKPEDYMCNAIVKQLKRSASTTGKGNVSGTGLAPATQYKFYDIFPTNISAIDLSYESTDQIEEFTVEFQVQYWTAGTGSDNGSDLTNTKIS